MFEVDVKKYMTEDGEWRENIKKNQFRCFLQLKFIFNVTKSHKLLPMHQWKYFAQILDGELIVICV